MLSLTRQKLLWVIFLLPIDFDFVDALRVSPGESPWMAAHSDVGECPDGPIPVTQSLKKKILCGYDSTLRPVKEHTNITAVEYNLYPVFFMFDEYSNKFELHNWVHMKWMDQHLKWKKEDFSDLEKVNLKINEIWVPDINHFEQAGGVKSLLDTTCEIFFDGNVSCVLPTAFQTQCMADMTTWPYDSHNCTVRVGSWSHLGNSINLSYAKEEGSHLYHDSDRYWMVIGYHTSRIEEELGNDTWPFLSYSFVLKRHSGFMVATVTVPAIVFMIVTLSTFWVDPNGANRLILIATNLIGHCVYMMFLGYYVPGNGDNTPRIVTYYRDSFFLAGISLLVSLCAGHMMIDTRAPPSWITSITDGILASSPGQFFLLSEEGTRDSADASETEEPNADAEHFRKLHKKWRHCATLLDRVSFLTFGVLLAILMYRLLPGNEKPTQTSSIFDD